MLTIHGSSSNEEISSCSRISQAMWLSLMPKLLLIRNRKRIGMMKMNLIFNDLTWDIIAISTETLLILKQN